MKERVRILLLMTAIVLSCYTPTVKAQEDITEWYEVLASEKMFKLHPQWRESVRWDHGVKPIKYFSDFSYESGDRLPIRYEGWFDDGRSWEWHGAVFVDETLLGGLVVEDRYSEYYPPWFARAL